MARYIGPKCKLMRREGTDLLLKSKSRSLDSNVKLIPSLDSMLIKKQDYQTMVSVERKTKIKKNIWGSRKAI